jgi:RNA polymerase sigma-70 factor (ECF subfamily)
MHRRLVERVMQGDHEAFSDLVRASTDRLVGIASLILHDAERARDAVQDALVLAWRDAPGLRDPDAWDAWVYRLTVRACYRIAARDRRRRVLELPAIAEDPRAPEIPDPAVAFADRDLVLRALSRLPIDHRAVLVAHFYLDLPIAGAAAVLDIPVGTCKSRLARALAAMRASIDQPDRPDTVLRAREMAG